MPTPNEKVKTLCAFQTILEQKSQLFTNIEINQLQELLATHQTQPFSMITALLEWCDKYDSIKQALDQEINRCDMIGDNSPPTQEDPVLEAQLIDNIMVILAKQANSQTTTNNQTNSDNPVNNQ
jgi:hypothetical protein